MGFDLVSFLDGKGDTSQVHAIKGSGEYVFGQNFANHLSDIGLGSRLVMNVVEGYQEADRWQIASQRLIE